MWVAVVFHVTIEASASVQVFSLLGIAVLVIWATPSTRDRVLRIDPTSAGHRRLRAVVRALDWLARFRVEPARPARAEVVDRDGTTLRGAPALALVLSRLPLTAWFALPALLLPAVRRAPVDDESGAARRASGGPALTLALLLVVAFGGRGAAGALPVGHRRRAASTRRRPPSTGSSATRTPTARGSTSTTPSDDSASPEYNEVRHAGATMGLYQAAAAGLPGALRSADRGIAWALDRLVERDDWAAFDGDGASRRPARRRSWSPG